MSPHKSDDSEDEWKKKDKKDKKDKEKKEKEKKEKEKDRDKKDKDKKDKKDKDKKDKHKDEKGKKDEETHKLTHPTPVGPGGIGFPAALQIQDGHHQFSPPAGYDKSRMDPSPPSFPTAPPAFPQAPSQGGPYGAPPPFPSPPGSAAPPPFSSAPSAPQQAAAPPPSGYRVPLATTSAFPDLQQAGQPPCYDADGVSPVFFGSALFPNSVHPCKIGPHLSPCVSVPYGGAEYYHNGRFDLLPYDPRSMELVLTSYGKIPPGRRPVEGGYEESGEKLYHGLAFVNGVKVPGKTGEHLGACNVSFGGAEVTVAENYEILCWR